MSNILQYSNVLIKMKEIWLRLSFKTTLDKICNEFDEI